MKLFWIDTNTGENTIWRLECYQQKLSCIILWFDYGRQSHWTDVWPSSHGSQCEPLRWLKCFSGDPLTSRIGFQVKGSLTNFDWSSHPQWCWPKCHLISRLAQLWLGVLDQELIWKLELSEGFSGMKYSLWLGSEIGLWKTQQCSRPSAQPARSVEKRLPCKSPWECQALFNHCISIPLLITLQCSHRVTT